MNTVGTGCYSPAMVHNNSGVSDSSSINGTPACGGYQGGDSLYTFTASASGALKIMRPNLGNWRALGYAIYSAA